MYSYGNYYTWAAAIASIIPYDGANTQTDGYTSETAGTSLCPAGWQLPYGRNTGNGATTKGFSYLDIQMGGTGTSINASTPGIEYRSNMWRSFPNNFIQSGFFTATSARSRGVTGIYWSSTASGYNYSYSFYIDSLNVSPGTSNGMVPRSGSTSIRCLTSP